MREKGVQFFPIDRGGDITYHGPGQIVGYPIFDMDHHFTDIHRFLRTLEEAVIGTLEAYQHQGRTHRRAHRCMAGLERPLQGPEDLRLRHPRQPVGDHARLRLQCEHRPELLREHRALRHR
jgi:hypothetical protein